MLQFRSNHSVVQKRSYVSTFLRCIQTHCSDNNGKREDMNYLHVLFKASGYPKSFIRRCLSEEKPKFWPEIPCVKSSSETTERVIKAFGIGVKYRPESIIRQQIMKPKDPLPVTEQSAVVYCIPCKKFDTRSDEHLPAFTLPYLTALIETKEPFPDEGIKDDP
ncbi:unnamed protein product [Dibothriocephalus latus]|uniref:Helix-turn-helix domain-containing protein n=1 Tax=Dibothriocephalus latus TaxID=60516 RepID=A0A3P6UZS9_DIBLA|nr:unnamed protein product [Dibothriocephalus latus]